jgi:diketogulonate reductase-like aldo/keto reductase
VLAKGVLPIIGARTPQQLADNLAAADLALSAEHLARLDAVSAVPLGTPYSYPENNRTRFANGHPERLEFPQTTVR